MSIVRCGFQGLIGEYEREIGGEGEVIGENRFGNSISNALFYRYTV